MPDRPRPAAASELESGSSLLCEGEQEAVRTHRPGGKGIGGRAESTGTASSSPETHQVMPPPVEYHESCKASQASTFPSTKTTKFVEMP